MTYLVVGACTCLAGFLAADLAASAWVALLIRLAGARARRWSPALARRFFAGARVLPFTAGLLFAGLVVAPGYVWLEPRGARESAGPLLAAATLLAMVLLLRATLGALASWRATRRIESKWLAAAERVALPGVRLPVWSVRDGRVAFWVCGLLRPRLVAGADILAALTLVERAAAFEHEQAHAASRDNLWRLLLAACPGALSVAPLGRRLENEWSAACEAAADRRAVGGDAATAVELASALVKVARLAPPMRALGVSALGTGDVAVRVRSLLDRGSRAPSLRAGGALAWTAIVMPLAAIATLSLDSGFVGLVHRLAELLVRRL